MRRMMYSGVLLLAWCWQTQAFAARGYGRAGCGLGSIIMGPDGNQTLAYTSNMDYIQPIGISAGTSNCLPDDQASALFEQEKFIQANLASLSKEMAQGNGDTLKAYASVLGCPKTVFGDFASQMQKSYGDIFSAPGSLAVLDATKDEAKANPVLAQQCTLLI